MASMVIRTEDSACTYILLHRKHSTTQPGVDGDKEGARRL